MEVNDTLKFKAYGWKKDTEQKRPHIEKVYQEHKQYYPEDSHGVIDEWQALIRNQAEIYKQDERLRKENEYQAKEQYRLDLDRQMKEKQFQKQADDAKRRNEGHLLDNTIGLGRQLTQQIKNLDLNQKHKLQDEYLRAMEENKRKALDAKQLQLLEDKNMLAQDRMANRNSQRAQLDKNSKYKQDLDNVADYHNYMKNQLAAEQKRKEDEDYLRGMQRENEKRDKEREDWYNKYKKISDDMDNRLKTTLAQAKPTLDRQRQLNQKIDDDADRYGNKLFDDYDKNRNQMQAQWRNAYNENQRNLQDKTRATQISKLKDKEDMDFKAREVMAYNQSEEGRKKEMDEQKRLYRETLQNQMTLNALNKFNYGKMTLQEKNINREDLRSYKNKDRNEVHALIPGIKNIPSIGTKPLMRGAMNVMDFSDSPPEGPKGRKGQMFFSPEPRQSEGFLGTETFQSPLPHQPGIIRNRSGMLYKPGTPTSSMYHSKAVSKTDFERFKGNTHNYDNRTLNTTRNAHSMATLYNPIVNPIDKSYKIYQH
jgi:hypothetical protein